MWLIVQQPRDHRAAAAPKIAVTMVKEEERASHVMLFGVEEKKAKISSGRFSEYFRRLARSLLLRELLLIALRTFALITS